MIYLSDVRSHRAHALMDGSGYVTNSCGYSASLISRHWIFRHAPLFGAGDEKMPQKCEGALIWRVVVIKRLKLDSKCLHEG